MAIDHSYMKLGKLPRRHDHRTLRLANYLAPALPSPPARVDYTCGTTDWGMMLNDQLGDCIIADGPGHATQVWTLNAAGAMVTPPDSVILATYEKWCGYNPADPTTDQGGIELDVLNNWRQQGFNGHALDAYVAIDLQDRNSKFEIRNSAVLPGVSNDDFRVSDVATAIWLFGGAYIGLELPLNAQNQAVWDVAPGMDSEPGSWGGHAVYLVAYDFVGSSSEKKDSEFRIPDSGPNIINPGLRIQNPKSRVASPVPPISGVRWCDPDRTANRTRAPYPASRNPYPGFQETNGPILTGPQIGLASPTLTCITWGQPKKMTWAWFEKYCSEAYALISKDWIKASGLAPSGFDLAALEMDLKLVTT